MATIARTASDPFNGHNPPSFPATTPDLNPDNDFDDHSSFAGNAGEENTDEGAVNENEFGDEEETNNEEESISTFETDPAPEPVYVTSNPELPLASTLEAPGFALGLLVGVLAAAILATAVALLIRRLRHGRPVSGRSVKAVSIQGVGARENQQDAVYLSDTALFDQQGLLLCVADGMGGLSNGAIISSTAVSAVSNTFVKANKSDPNRLLVQMLQAAASSVNTILAPNYGAGGTTLLIGYLQAGMFWYCSVGDSRICLCREGELIHLNRRHVFEDELLLTHVNGGDLTYDRAKTYEKRGALTSYLGMGPLKYMDLPDSCVRTHKGDRFILMSDGVFNTLTDQEIVKLLRGKTATLPERLSSEVESRKVKFQDNYSAVVVEIC
ncbi:MAG: serine/threonine-protein phosphatase [Oscillospiraceae bacterium]|nr:serine/threonine-protein phosphatase [Oscillospiraceae bacterium]MBR0393442.1 serine/threonine-protein phosphatase [Oscillospiraceae bacterium]